MKLIRNKENTIITWDGLTLGKLISIKHALEDVEKKQVITTLQKEILNFLMEVLK